MRLQGQTARRWQLTLRGHGYRAAALTRRMVGYLEVFSSSIDRFSVGLFEAIGSMDGVLAKQRGLVMFRLAVVLVFI
jgi:hypothetical protein